jgi:hypothetical protein
VDREGETGRRQLDADSYRQLLRPGVSGVRFYGGIDKGLFDAVVTRKAATPERQASAPICQAGER